MRAGIRSDCLIIKIPASGIVRLTKDELVKYELNKYEPNWLGTLAIKLWNQITGR